jgi:hypothetical protein
MYMISYPCDSFEHVLGVCSAKQTLTFEDVGWQVYTAT